MQAKAWDMFVNVDGQYGRTICPLPHAQLDNPIVPRSTVEQWDKVSCQDRFEEIKHKLTSEEQGLLVSLLLHISGGNLEDSSLWDMVRSHALLMHSSDNFTDVWLRYKLRDGQTELAKRMFQEAKNDGLNFAFSTPVASINQSASGDGPVTIRTVNNQTFRGRKVISTIPLNVLKDIQFSPPLSQRRQEAINIGHINHMTKVHADVSNKELERWNGMRFPGHLMYGYADGALPNGDVHIVAFGKDDRETFIPENDANKTIDALNDLHPMHVKRLVSQQRAFRLAKPCVLTRTYSYCTTGVQTPTQRVARRGGDLVICRSTKTNCRAAMGTFFSPLPTGRMVGGLQLMGPWSRAL
jgi:hypothetical protein